MTQEISSLFREERVFSPSPEFVRNSTSPSLEQYERLYRESIEHPEKFWADQAREHLEWFQPFERTMNYHPEKIGRDEAPYLSFFSGGRLNVSYNCLDRHLTTSRRNKAAFLWQGEREEEKRTLTYGELHREVCRFANVLKKHGVRERSTVTIYLPLVPELAIAMLACARIGAIHSVVFSAFSAESLRSRIRDCSSSLLITADVGFHGGRVIPLKATADTALLECPSVKTVIVYNRGGTTVDMNAERDRWWHEEVNDAGITNDCPCASLASEHPLYILYTSGSTGKPKGVLHTTGGYLLYAHLTFKSIFDLKDNEVYWCTADIGWVTGHSYVVYGPLSNGATCVMFEGVPTYPQPDRFWKVIEDYSVNVFYTAPTAIRALMRLGDDWPKRRNLSSLRLLGTVGEPINPEAWLWYYRVIGGERCPIVDTWWQTETGGIMITTFPGAHSMKPGSAGKPFFGVLPEVLREDGSPVSVGEGGSLAIARAWPGMIRGVFGDPRSELVKRVYFSKYAEKYFTGDGCRIDEDGYYWLLGRIDDVINVSAHRFATAEIESALVSHQSVAEAAVVGFPHETKGQGIYCFVTLKQGYEPSVDLEKTLVGHVRQQISPIATPEKIHFTSALPKTRSGKIMRRILRKIAAGDLSDIGDTSTLADPSVVETLIATRQG